MAHSKSKFKIEWLKRKDDNGHLLKWWCSAHETDRFRAKCNLCEKEIQVANSGVSALIQHSKQKIHKEKACIQLAAHKIEPEKEKDEQPSSSQQSLEDSQQSSKQGSIKDFFTKSAVNQSSTTDKESKRSDALTLQDQILQAETLWALKTAHENFSF